jgi:hypothetical protein
MTSRRRDLVCTRLASEADRIAVFGSIVTVAAALRALEPTRRPGAWTDSQCPKPANSALTTREKRARRRLVGAIVLALGAAVVVPMFLESDPKPLGPDVQIQIPAIDDAKFQNRLTPPGKV